MDNDSNNRLSAKELAKAANITLEQAKSFIAKYDKNGDGELGPSEFQDLKKQILGSSKRGIRYKTPENTMIKDILINIQMVNYQLMN